jgi:hypothetical protein
MKTTLENRRPSSDIGDNPYFSILYHHGAIYHEINTQPVTIKLLHRESISHYDSNPRIIWSKAKLFWLLVKQWDRH